MRWLPFFFSLLRADRINARSHIAITIRDLSAFSKNQLKLASMGCIDNMLILLRDKENGLKAVALATLRHLSCNDELKPQILQVAAVRTIIEDIPRASEEYCCQAAALIANLSDFGPNKVTLVGLGIMSILPILSDIKNDEILQVRFE